MSLDESRTRWFIYIRVKEPYDPVLKIKEPYVPPYLATPPKIQQLPTRFFK
jgi:hypothetical protein